ncbi:MAG: hypothetical protein IBJ03_02670 [Gemmatimonadaceae bacterium]|nr:hypothetical protein [Gemmatimonadaceae bacterium]
MPESGQASASFARGLDRVANLVQALEALPTVSWRTLQRRCQSLDGNMPSQLAARARLQAASMVPDGWMCKSDKLLLRGIGTGLRLLAHGLALAGEVAVAVSRDEPFYLSGNRQSSGKAYVDRYMELRYGLQQAMVTAIGKDTMTLLVLQAVMETLLHAEEQSRSDFSVIYSWIAPEVPLSQVDASLAV